MEPSVFTSAGQPQRSETSRSVAAIFTSPARASASTLDRIGIEFFRSTIPWTSESSFTRSLLRTVISMDGCYLLLLTTPRLTLSLTERDVARMVDPTATGHGPAIWPVYERVHGSTVRARPCATNDASRKGVPVGEGICAPGVEEAANFIETLARSC